MQIAISDEVSFKYFKPGTKARVISDSHDIFKPGTIVTILEDSDVPFCKDKNGIRYPLINDELEIIPD